MSFHRLPKIKKWTLLLSELGQKELENLNELVIQELTNRKNANRYFPDLNDLETNLIIKGLKVNAIKHYKARVGVLYPSLPRSVIDNAVKVKINKLLNQ